GAQAPAAEEPEPGIPALLVRAEGPAEALRGFERRDAARPLELVEQVAEPARGVDARERQAAGGLGLAQGHPDRVPRLERGVAPGLPEVERGLDLVAPELHPLPPNLHQRRLEPAQCLQLVERQPLATQRNLPLELEDLVQREPAAALELGRLHHGTRREPELRPLARPPGGEE